MSKKSSFLKRSVTTIACLGLTAMTLPSFAQGGSSTTPPDTTGVCDPPGILSKSTVKLVNQAVVEIRFTDNALNGKSAVFFDANNNVITATINQDLIFASGLAVGTEYTAYTFDPCGDTLSLGVVNKASGSDNSIELSEELYRAFVDWTLNPQGVTLDAFVWQLPNVSTLEKLAFVQEHLNNGHPYEYQGSGEPHPQTHVEEYVLSREFELKRRRCNCSVFTTVYVGRKGSSNIIPINPSNSEEGWIPNEDAQFGGQYPNSNAYWEERYVYTGAIKEHWMKSEQTSTNISQQGKTRGRITSTLDGGSPNTRPMGLYSLRYNYSCVDQFIGFPSDCGCKKDIIVRSNYATKIQTDATTIGSGAQRWSKAKAEDAAAFFKLDYASGTSTVYASNRKFGERTAQTTGNGQWIKAAVELTAGIVSAVIAGTGSAATTAVNNAQSQLNTLFTMAPFNSTGSGSTTSSSTLINDTKYDYLMPNRPVEYDLVSAASLDVSGLFAYTNRAGVYASGYLMGLIRENAGTETGCCSGKQLRWLADAEWWAPSSFQDVRDDMGSFLGLYPPFTGHGQNPWTNAFYLTGNIGKWTNPAPSNCLSPVPVNRQQQQTNITAIQAPNVWSVTAQSGNIVLNQSKSTPISYRVIDVVGRVVASGRTTDGSTILYNPTADGPSKVFIVETDDGSGRRVDKLQP